MESSSKEYYLIGSLRNPEILILGNELRANGIKIFDSWFAAGAEADNSWRDYCKNLGMTYQEALQDYSAQHVFQFDKFHLDRCGGAILVYPAGKSAHLELGYIIGQGKPGFVLLDSTPDRYDVMLNFATGVFSSVNELVKKLKETKNV